LAQRVADIIIGSGDTEADLKMVPVFQDIEITKDKGRTGLDNDRPVILRQYFKTTAGQFVTCFQRLVWITHSADPNLARPLAGDSCVNNSGAFTLTSTN